MDVNEFIEAMLSPKKTEQWLVHVLYWTNHGDDKVNSMVEMDEVVTYHPTEARARAYEGAMVDSFIKNPAGRSGMRIRVSKIVEIISDIELEYDEVAPRQ
jgi:hypothetical protein